MAARCAVAIRKLAGGGVNFVDVLFRQFVDGDLGCASYLIGDEAAHEAAVVDPAFAIEQYLEAAEADGLRIVAALETHTHADHVSGHGRLALECGARVNVHPAAQPEFPFEALEDGSEIRLGDVTIRVVHTPGHRPEHCAFVVGDAVLTGDSLFVGDVARPDLAVEASEGAEGLFHSLRRLTELPDGVTVYPGHVAGSLCGAAMRPERRSTIAAERRSNPGLAHSTVDEFVAAAMSATATPRPPNMDRIVELNRGPFLGAPPPLRERASADGATVLDVRSADEFARAHVRGALNVPLDSSGFATKAGFVLVPDERIVLHASTQHDAERAARGLNAVGFLDLEGYLVHTPLTERFDPVRIDELDGLLARGDVEVLDVREKDERDEGYIAGSRHVPYRLLRAGGRDAVDGKRPIVTICESGARAAIAASVLAAAGIEARPVLHGGIPDWERRGGHTVSFRRCGS